MAVFILWELIKLPWLVLATYPIQQVDCMAVFILWELIKLPWLVLATYPIQHLISQKLEPYHTTFIYQV